MRAAYGGVVVGFAIRIHVPFSNLDIRTAFRQRSHALRPIMAIVWCPGWAQAFTRAVQPQHCHGRLRALPAGARPCWIQHVLPVSGAKIARLSPRRLMGSIIPKSLVSEMRHWGYRARQVRRASR